MDKFNAEDFIQLTNSSDKDETERLVKKIFSAVDIDNSGFIDQVEMLKMMTMFGEHMRKKAGSE
jgi:Ca2+-binding EF-hand superfamily protein